MTDPHTATPHVTTKTELLRRVTMFSRLSRRHLAHLASLFDDVTVPAGRVLLRQAELPREFLVVVEGRAQVTRDGVTVGLVGPGEIIGELAILHQHTRTATVTALTEMTLLVAEPRLLSALLDEHPVIADAVAHMERAHLDGLAEPPLSA